MKALNDRVHQLTTELQVVKTENTALREQNNFLQYLLTKGYGDGHASLRNSSYMAGSALLGVALVLAFPWSRQLLTGVNASVGDGPQGKARITVPTTPSSFLL